MGDDVMLKRTEIMHALHRSVRHYARSQVLKVSIFTLFSLAVDKILCLNEAQNFRRFSITPSQNIFEVCWTDYSACIGCDCLQALALQVQR